MMMVPMFEPRPWTNIASATWNLIQTRDDAKFSGLSAFPFGEKGMPEFCQVQMNQLQVEILDPQMVVPAEAIAFCLGQAAFD